jgi:Putative zinc-finger
MQMTRDTLFKQQRCKRVLDRLDSYVHGELLAETNLDLLEHFRTCSGCAGEAAERTRLRNRVRTAVRKIQVPSDLEARVRAGLRERRVESTGWSRQIMALAACLAICFGAWLVYQLGSVRTTAARQESYIASLTNRVASIMRVGLGDHIHCAVFKKYPSRPPSLAAVEAEIAPEYRELLPAVQEKIPQGMDLMTAHDCRYHGRHFVHVVFRGHGHLLSLVIARKSESESFDIEGIAPALSTAGVPVYAAAVQKFQIAAFETGEHLVYTISDLPGQRNTQVMAALVPAVKAMLAKIG